LAVELIFTALAAGKTVDQVQRENDLSQPDEKTVCGIKILIQDATEHETHVNLGQG